MGNQLTTLFTYFVIYLLDLKDKLEKKYFDFRNSNQTRDTYEVIKKQENQPSKTKIISIEDISNYVKNKKKENKTEYKVISNGDDEEMALKSVDDKSIYDDHVGDGKEKNREIVISNSNDKVEKTNDEKYDFHDEDDLEFDDGLLDNNKIEDLKNDVMSLEI